MMEVVKALNNNIILAKDQTGDEKVLFGTGIGFKKRRGDEVDQTLISKVFMSEHESHHDQSVEDFEPEILMIAAKIIDLGEKVLSQKFGAGLLFSLTDHLSFAINSGKENENPIKWEVPHLYYKEYQIGVQGLAIVKDELGVELLPEEASFIALHFVNGQISQPNMETTLQITEIIKKTVKIVQTIFGIVLDKTTSDYSRFITHLRYFIIRQQNNQPASIMDKDIRAMIQERYMKSYACALIIKDMLQRDYKWAVSEDELVYLVIHIERIIKTE